MIPANPNFIYAILRQHKRFEALRNFTLEQGQEELDRENRFRKDRGDDSSPKVSFSMSEMQRPLRVPETPSTLSHFEIGEDSESETEEGSPESKKPTKKNSETPQSPSSVTSPTASTSDAEDVVPMQLRGMSEKARGKLPEGAFRRQGSTASLGSHVSGIATPIAGGFGFIPSNAWVRPLLSHLQSQLTGVCRSRLGSHTFPCTQSLQQSTSCAPSSLRS